MFPIGGTYVHPIVTNDSNESNCETAYESRVTSGPSGAYTMSTASLPIKHSGSGLTFDWSGSDITPTILPALPPGHSYVGTYTFTLKAYIK